MLHSKGGQKHQLSNFLKTYTLLLTKPPSKQISFLYFHYNQYREEVPNNNGKRYHFSPYYLVWNEDHYYVVGFCEKHQRITTFRVDRMKSISILCSDAVPQPKDFNLPDFTRQVFDMYDGTKEKVIKLEMWSDSTPIMLYYVDGDPINGFTHISVKEAINS